MKKFVLLLSLCVLASPVFAAPITVDNCGRTLSFDTPPERVVSLGQAPTEMLYSLGLGDRVMGTAVWFNEVMPEFKSINEKVERLADNDPSFESVVAKKPQLVTAQYEWHIGPEGIVGTYEQFEKLGVQTYVMPTDCVGKDNSTGGDGTRTKAFEIDSIYLAIKQLSTIFDVPSAGEKLTADMQQRQSDAVARAKAIANKELSALVWFSSPDIDLDPYVAGLDGVPGYMLKTLGIRNIIQSNEEWPLVGWETIAKANPDVIVIARMDRRRFPVDDYKVKLEFLRTDPVTSQLDAVVNDRIIIVDAHAIQPSIRIATGLETIVDALEQFDLSK